MDCGNEVYRDLLDLKDIGIAIPGSAVSKLNFACFRIEKVGSEDKGGLSLITKQLILFNMSFFSSLPAGLLNEIVFASVISDHPLVTSAEEFLTTFNNQALVFSKIDRSLRV